VAPAAAASVLKASLESAMSKRRAAWAGVAAAGLGLIGYAGWWWLFALPRGINRDGFGRIELGMTQAEVEAVLGARSAETAGDCPFDVCEPPAGQVRAKGHPPECRYECWFSAWGSVGVFFHPDGTVADKEYLEKRPPPPFWERVQQWVGL
jgi:hypothetical protein